MAQSKEINEKKHLTARAAADLVGYSSDYVTRLAREGKIVASRNGNQWFVEPESLKLFSLTAEAEKRERKEQLREERLRERSAILKDAHEAVLISQIDSQRNSALAQTAILTASLFLLGNIFWFSFESKLNVQVLFGGISNIAQQLAEVVIDPIPEFVSQVASYAFIDTAEHGSQHRESVPQVVDAETSDQEDFQGIVLFEKEIENEELANVRNSFSDEVNVEFDSEDSGIITPVFKERSGESYRFLLVPVKPPGN